MLLGSLETRPDQRDLVSWGGNALLRFLLKRMEHVNDPKKLDRIDDAVGIAIEVVDDFEHATATKSLQGLGGGMLGTALSIVDRLAHDPANLRRKDPQIIARRTNPFDGFARHHVVGYIAILL